MRTETYTLDVRCPMRFEKYIDKRDERCRPDCAWLMTDDDGNQVCAIAVLAGVESKWSVRARFDDYVVGREE